MIASGTPASQPSLRCRAYSHKVRVRYDASISLLASEVAVQPCKYVKGFLAHSNKKTKKKRGIHGLMPHGNFFFDRHPRRGWRDIFFVFLLSFVEPNFTFLFCTWDLSRLFFSLPTHQPRFISHRRSWEVCVCAHPSMLWAYHSCTGLFPSSSIQVPFTFFLHCLYVSMIEYF